MGWEIVYYAIASLAVSLALSAINKPKPNKPEKGKLDFPISEEGVEYGIGFGTNIEKQSIVAWYGNLSTTKIKSKGGKK